MAEVTRVPIHPIKKGSLTKLWFGILLAVLAAGGIAWATAPVSTTVDVVKEGLGPKAQIGDVVFVKYVGKLSDGTEFDRSQPLPIPPGIFPDGFPFPVEEGQTVPGFFKGLQQVQTGGKYVFNIPGDDGYGANPPEGSPIKPNADLVFDVEVVEIMKREDFDRREAALMQMMQAQQGGGEGAPAGPPAGAPPSE